MTESGKPPPAKPRKSAFDEAMKGVTPLANRDKLRRHSKARPGATLLSKEDERIIAFAVQRSGERISAVAEGIDRRLLRQLQREEFDIDLHIDLHGSDSETARHLLLDGLQDAAQRGARCALIVHGRGLHSEEGPVLKEATIGWLTTPPLAALVMAFASAAPEHGGAGATLVLLRRVR